MTAVDFKRDHKKAVDSLQYLNDYCNSGGCRDCTFTILGNCPFHMLDNDNFNDLRTRSKRLEDDEDETT